MRYRREKPSHSRRVCSATTPVSVAGVANARTEAALRGRHHHRPSYPDSRTLYYLRVSFTLLYVPTEFETR